MHCISINWTVSHNRLCDQEELSASIFQQHKNNQQPHCQSSKLTCYKEAVNTTARDIIMIWFCLFACKDKDAKPNRDSAEDEWSTPMHFVSNTELGQPIHTATSIESSGLITAGPNGLWLLPWDGNSPHEIDVSGLPVGDIVFLEATNTDHLLAYVYGHGLYSTKWGDDLNWTLSETGLTAPLLTTLNPDSKPYPMALTEDETGITWLATAGGLFTTNDPELGWTPVDLSSSGSLNPLFSDVASNSGSVAAVSFLPLSILPSQYSGLLSGRVFYKENGEEDWEELGTGLDSNYTAAVCLSDTGELYVGTLDQGLWWYKDEQWQAIEGGPSDVVGLEWNENGLSVGSANHGIWRYQNENWSQRGNAPVTALSKGWGTGADGSVWFLEEGTGTTPNQPEGTVHVALSFHTNFYHSYRGDSVDDDGFGLDIDVIRNTLDWLDAHPYVKGNWDVDNAFTTDDWMIEHSPDIISRISERVANGQDEIRLMAWNNGAMAASTEAEFSQAVLRAFESNENTFGAVVPGVQPQECMFSPDHLQWYPDNGVEWVTLFYAANGFTALREDITLEGIAQYNPVALNDPLSEASMTLVPVYHHADVLDHGGLSGWAKQLSKQSDEDQILVIHFDADAESWESFSLELEAANALPFVEWTTISNYLDTHVTVDSVDIHGDVADGTGDGFQSWAEKDFNHRQFTEVVKARRSAEVAQFLAPEDTAVQSLLEAAMTPRLLALSTTNYGLAAPFLHEDRVASATEQAEEARTMAEEALSMALELWPVESGQIQVINPRQSTGTTLLEFEIHLMAGTWNNTSNLNVTDELGNALPLHAELLESNTLRDVIRVQLVAAVAAESVTIWQWTHDVVPTTDPESPIEPILTNLMPPIIGCNEIESEGSLLSSSVITEGPSVQKQEIWSVSGCGSNGTVKRHLEHWTGLNGVVIRIDGTIPEIPDVEDLETVVLSPLGCDNGIESLFWRSYAGYTRSRPARTPVETWNGQAADGWVGMKCGDGRNTFVSHRTQQRSSMAFAPVRNAGENSFMAPLGTIWGDGPWHFARKTGGHGIGEITTSTVGSQFRPAAPDWSGQRIEYTLLVTDGTNTEELDLFAHPPLVRVGGTTPN